jgi:hypothetical protein
MVTSDETYTLWYYDLLRAARCCIEVSTVQDIPKAVEFARSLSEAEVQAMVGRAHAFVDKFLSHKSHITYMAGILYMCSHIQKNVKHISTTN